MKSILLLFLCVSCINYYKEPINTVKKDKTKQNFYNVEYISNYDGDTIKFKIFSLKESNGDISITRTVRVNGIDTDELKNKDEKRKNKAIKAKSFTEKTLLNAKTINLYNCTSEKYGRLLCDVEVDNNNLSNIILNKRLAREYHGGKRE